MKALPEDVETSALVDALADGWGFTVESAEYAAVGAGSYHWIVGGPAGARGFVTVDDLDGQACLGDTRESVFDALGRAFDTAAALRASGLSFVVAPIPASGGGTVRRLGPRHTIALFPFMDGEAGEYGRYGPGVAAAIVAMLAQLHRATPAVRSVAGSVGLDLQGRGRLEAGLREVDQPWSGGPFSEPARHAFAAHASDLSDLLGLADRLAAEVERRGGEWVITHGEPHSANVMRTGESHVLLDWDTVALAPPERDLWMLADDSADEAAVAYAEATGRSVDQDALDFFRLTWDLKDIANYLSQVRSPHDRNEDTEKAYDVLTNCLAIRDQWEELL